MRLDLSYPIVTTLLHLHAFLLLPLFHHLWVGTGTGNANFFYASTLVFGLANGGALLDMLWAGLRVAIGEVGEDYVVAQK
jgi:GPI-anchor transamidase subunit U